MSFTFQEEYLDLILVPLGLLIIFGYHLFFLYRYLHTPLTTVLGFENRDKTIWVGKVMQSTDPKEVQNALGTITSNITVATFLSTLSLSLCSLIGAWVANSSSTNKYIPSQIIYGSTKPAIASIKYVCLIACFLVAFSFFVQAARHFVHANYIISTPRSAALSMSQVDLLVTRGGEFWSIGLRALYVALTMMLWFFGPIPMFVSSVFMVVVLHCHDSQKVGDQKDG